jgi:transposase
LRTVDRHIVLPPMTLDELIEFDHPARDVWRFVAAADLTILYDRIRARDPQAGRPAIDPRILVALWLYAFLCGTTSSRRLARLCNHDHNAFRWLAGGVHVGQRTLSSFRTDHLDFLERLFEHSVAVLRANGQVDLRRVSQDGIRVRASAGAASFRRRPTLERLLRQTSQEVHALRVQAGRVDAAQTPDNSSPGDAAAALGNPGKPLTRKQAAVLRGAEDRLRRVTQALEQMAELEAHRGPDDAEPRVSTTDPDARVMRQADGGYRPSVNYQFSTTPDKQVMVGLSVSKQGTDQGHLRPMLEQIEARFGERPREALVDGGFVNKEDIEALQKGAGGKASCVVYAPVPKAKKEGVDKHAPHRGDSPEVAEWRARMARPAAKEIYKQRAATSECVNAQARNRGLVRLFVRGLQKIKAIGLWFATVHNMARGFALLPRPELAT